jgi:hypothetical protein
VPLGNAFATFRKNHVLKDPKILVTPDQKPKHFPKIYAPPQNFTRQKNDIQQVRRWLATNIRRHRTKFTRYDDLAAGPCVPALGPSWRRHYFPSLRNIGKRICRHTASHPRSTQSTVGHWHVVV